MNTPNKISVVIPAKNEGGGLPLILPELVALDIIDEVIVVDDGSTDNTRDICLENNVKVISHPYSKGNGAAIKTGVRNSTGDLIVFMDADGQHRPSDIRGLLEAMDGGDYDMVVGARQGLESQANAARGGVNHIYNRLASWIVGRKVEDLTSGFRLVKAKKFKEFLYMLPNGFSYPTTSTMAFFRAGYSVNYMPFIAEKRIGKSHLNLFKDGVRFLLIIFKIGTLYSPLKIFFPASCLIFILGMLNYGITYSLEGRFTNMSALLMLTSVIIFMMGLIAEQITTLLYKDSSD